MRRGSLENDDGLAVGPDAVPELGLGLARLMEVPRVLVSNGSPGPLERRANGSVRVPVRLPAAGNARGRRPQGSGSRRP
jgi:hypothetical protein